MHAMGVLVELASKEDLAAILETGQDAIFERIRLRRRYLPVDLLRMPASDLAAAVCAETGGEPPAMEALLSGLQRYAVAW
jgi:hypothetical protein